jgi:ribonuclease HI
VEHKAVAYVDGGCFPNPGRGGWAAVLMTDTYQTEVWGFEEGSTNQRAEILAAIEALEALYELTEIEIVSDSQYLVKCAGGEWRRRTNKDLWERLDKASEGLDVTYRWVRGHAGNPGNERAHELVEWLLQQAA